MTGLSNLWEIEVSLDMSEIENKISRDIWLTLSTLAVKLAATISNTIGIL